jgi:hypothetical protein
MAGKAAMPSPADAAENPVAIDPFRSSISRDRRNAANATHEIT